MAKKKQPKKGKVKPADDSSPGPSPLTLSYEQKEMLINIADMGATDSELAHAVGVSRPTYLAYLERDPEFKGRIKAAKIKSDGEVFAALKKSAVGYEHDETKFFVCRVDKDCDTVTSVETVKKYPPNAMSIKFYLMNRQPMKFRNKIDLDMAELAGMDFNELEAKVKEIIAQRQREDGE